MAAPLVMLGVIHRDPEGAERLALALAGREWGLVSVEVSPFALAWRRRRGPELLARLAANLPAAARAAGLSPAEAAAHPGPAWLRAYLEPPYEWTVSRRLAAARGAPCVALDFSALSRRLLAGADELVGPANLARLLSAPVPAGAGLERRRAADLMAGRGGWPRPPAPEPAREAGLARRIARLAAAAARRGRGGLVHVGGWQHLLSGQDPPALADRLGAAGQDRVLI